MVMQPFHQQVMEFFAEGIRQLVRQWDGCLYFHGDGLYYLIEKSPKFYFN
jgi:hypothetical protein